MKIKEIKEGFFFFTFYLASVFYFISCNGSMVLVNYNTMCKIKASVA